MKLIKIGEVWNSANRFLSDFFGLLPSKNFAAMETWHNDFSSLSPFLIRGASNGAIAKARMLTHVVEVRVMGDPLGYYSGTPPYDHPVYKTTSLLRPYSFKPKVKNIDSFYYFEDPVNATTSLLRPGFYGPTVVALTGFHCNTTTMQTQGQGLWTKVPPESTKPLKCTGLISLRASFPIWASEPGLSSRVRAPRASTFHDIP